ncbi:heptosyltransferase-2 [Balneicella halophila]|uniref:Heptosyltransferase-2 n=1 Tax=Balneicella halophila TaxID=1537566 RepID=A0A7L4UPJ9_BALHA|nr:glycosyltransferase family 9 protein [Balneicella halophila]PVX51725.1 heptosyltransferase-2 [Balneicella halophila]
MGEKKKIKILIIRFSSIGDVLQCMGIIGGIRKRYPSAEIHWVVRSDIAPILEIDSRIDKIWAFDKNNGFKGLWDLTGKLHKENFTHIYDAHSNIRSNIIKLSLCPFWKRWIGATPKYTLRSKNRLKRILLFNFRVNLFPKPFEGMVSYQKPLEKWGITELHIAPNSWNFPNDSMQKVKNLVPHELKEYICLVPSAAWELKRWPINYWKDLIVLMPEQKFIIIGGPQDDFCEEIASVAPDRTKNFAGKTSLLDSCYTVHETALTISADTGFIHAADLFGKKGIFLAGPTAFGFPTGNQIRVLEKEMPCRPCTKDGRGTCSQEIHKECLISLTPNLVAQTVKAMLD